MPSTVYLAPTVNYFSTTLNGSISDSATTVTLNSVTNLQAPGYLIIDREDGSGSATPNSREVISFTGISGSDITGVTRAADGSTARSHSDGALVESTPTVGLWNSLATIVSSGFDGAGYLRAIASPVSISQLHTTQVNATRFVGMQGHFYWSRGGALATVLNSAADHNHFSLQRATKNLSLVTVYSSLISAPSLTPYELDISWASGPTGDFTSIFGTRQFINIGEYTSVSSNTPGVLSLTSLASGIVLRYEIRKHGDSAGIMTQLVATERA